MIEPVKVKKGDDRVLINGQPPKVDVRLVSEVNWKSITESHKRLVELLKHIRKDVEWNDPSPTLDWINKELTKASKL